jgi:hypothetical protein
MISDGLQEHDLSEVDIEERWKIIKKIIKDNAKVVLGFRQNIVRNEWFDEKCKEKLQDKNNARIKMLQVKTRSSVEENKEKRRTANSMCKNKKRKWENEKLLQMRADFKEHLSCKYHKEVKKVRTDFQPRINFCKDKDGNLITSNKQGQDYGSLGTTFFTTAE